MRIIIKFILNNIKEKKLRTLLIVMSVAAACALFFTSNGIAGSYKSAYINMLKSSYGNADIMINANTKSPSTYFNIDKAGFFKDRTDYIVGVMDGTGSYQINKKENLNISFKGIDLEDLKEMNPVGLTQDLSLTPFTGNKIIISDKMAAKYNFKAGQKISIKVGEAKETFNIVGIAQQESFFKLEKNNMVAIIPRETLSNFNLAKGRVSTIFIKSKNDQDKEQLVADLGTAYKDYTVAETINQKEIDQDLQTTTVSFFMMLTVVLVMCIFIIYTAFKVILMERMPVIGTFRSIGATKKMTDIVLIVESIIYGALGGIAGNIFGIGILYVVGVIMNPYKEYLKATLVFPPQLLIQTFIFGIMVALISAIIPILSVSKISVKDIVLNNVDTAQKTKIWKLIIGLVLIVFSIIIPLNPSKNASATMLLDVLAMISVIVAVIIFIPYITSLFIFLLSGVYSLIFGNEGILAAKNLRNNKSIINNISLLSIAISALLMINVISFSIGKEMVKAYDAWSCEVFVGLNVSDINQNDENIRKISSINGVTDLSGILSSNNTVVDSSYTTNSKIMDIDSIDSKKFPDFINVEFKDGSNGLPANFDQDRNIIITTQLKSRFNVQLGDNITLVTPSGKKQYKVVAFFTTLMENGDYAFIPPVYMKNDFKVRSFNKIFVKTNKDSNVIKEQIKNKFAGTNTFVDTVKNMEQDNAKSNEGMMNQLRSFAYISVLIGAFGVLNNFIISFIERKRSFAVLVSIGMSKWQSVKILFIEALSVGLIGGSMGVVTGLGLTSIIPFVLKAMDLPIPMYYTPSLFITSFILSIFITLIATVSPAIKSSKMNVIEAIKYE